jgi:hypothetical protein
MYFSLKARGSMLLKNLIASLRKPFIIILFFLAIIVSRYLRWMSLPVFLYQQNTFLQFCSFLLAFCIFAYFSFTVELIRETGLWSADLTIFHPGKIAVGIKLRMGDCVYDVTWYCAQDFPLLSNRRRATVSSANNLLAWAACDVITQ